ncbi:MAG: DoxX family protein [Gemmatimonadales bacterium]|nr:MAG: DoxX family protein [Gemmatimonadales bacterium]
MVPPPPDSTGTTSSRRFRADFHPRKGFRTVPTSIPTFSRLEPLALNVLRFVTGFLFFQHGAAKLYGWFGGSVVAFPDLRFFAGGIEFFGGLLIMIGLFTRPVAFLCAGLMAFAYFIAHAPQGFWPYANSGSLAALYCFVFLYLVLRGGGALSVDGVLARRETRAREREAVAGSAGTAPGGAETAPVGDVPPTA